MKPFKSDATCEKCGETYITTVFVPKGHWHTWLEGDPDADVLVRTCSRCSWSWLEAPLPPAKTVLTAATVRWYAEGARLHRGAVTAVRSVEMAEMDQPMREYLHDGEGRVLLLDAGLQPWETCHITVHEFAHRDATTVEWAKHFKGVAWRVARAPERRMTYAKWEDELLGGKYPEAITLPLTKKEWHRHRRKLGRLAPPAKAGGTWAADESIMRRAFYTTHGGDTFEVTIKAKATLFFKIAPRICDLAGELRDDEGGPLVRGWHSLDEAE